jgi:peptide/nickel transport system ATP-binding protein
MPLMTFLLQVTNLSTHFPLPTGTVRAVDGVDLELVDGETLALVGESGCGKSVTAYSLMRLVAPPGRIVSGSVLFEGRDLLLLPEEEMRAVRGNRISMIFQEPMSALNPVLTVGFQVAETLHRHRRLSRREAHAETVALLTQVGIPSPEERYASYPHELSGGMKQRVLIAMALACRPRLLIADEPTTALDVTIQAQILELIDRLKEESRMGLILITHDLGIVAERAHRTAVMYGGRIVETAATDELIAHPAHPYTVGLLGSLPENSRPGEPLQTIPGHVPNLLGQLTGCGFCERCPVALPACRHELPPLRQVGPGHTVRCWKVA